MYNPIHDPFFPCKINGKSVQIPMHKVLLGEIRENPFHPDPSISALLRYIPSLFLQTLSLEINTDEWADLTHKGTDSKYIGSYRDRLNSAIDEMGEFFAMRPDRNGFYQHFDLKKFKEPKTDIDALLLHFVSGNNPMHHRPGHILKQLCASCALTVLIHHNYFCPAGTVGHANVRGQTCYLCMISEDDIFKRMILNTCFPSFINNNDLMKYGWTDDSEANLPTWIRPGRPDNKGFTDYPKNTGLVRAVLYTPRHAFLEIINEEGQCDLCGIETDKIVRQYYWKRYGHKINAKGVSVRHPTQAVYIDKDMILPLNYNTSIWRNLGCLAVKDFESSGKNYDVAPVVGQYQNVMADGNPLFYLELMTYNANQAKLLDFHHSFINLPVLSEKMEEFYFLIECYTSSFTSMLSSFRYYGTAGKKRERVPLIQINSRHTELTYKSGRETLGSMESFHKFFRENSLEKILEANLEKLRKTLNSEFNILSRNEYAWDDIGAQKKLNAQKRKLAKSLNNTISDFLKRAGKE